MSLAAVLGIGIWLRWRFIHSVQLYPDEFVTLLAVRMIGEKGLPIMPSGLFYDHGLLFSYAGSIAVLFGPARWLVRYASLLFGTSTLVLLFWVAKRWLSTGAGVITVAALAIAPSAIHWSGRARMYALLQLLVLLTLFLIYEGVTQRRTSLRWLALLAYLGATLAHFAAVALAPPLFVATVILAWLSHFKSQDEVSRVGWRPPSISPQRGENRSTSLPVGGIEGGLSTNLRIALKQWRVWLELAAFTGVLIIAFLVKRAGQPKGIDALDGSAGQAATGLIQVFTIYSDFSFNLLDGWQAIAPFYLTLPALIFTLFALIAIIKSFVTLVKALKQISPNPQPTLRLRSLQPRSGQVSNLQSPISNLHFPTLFLSLILIITTLEMILLVSPDRRDDKYQFMLLPVLLLLGTQGMIIVGQWLQKVSPNSITHHALHITQLFPTLIAALIIAATWPAVQTLLKNTGDDYDSAFAYVQQHWQDGDTILTGTPAVAAFYLGRNDFYSVQRRGGYDYRILTVDNQPVDRWLASPAIRTEADLHQTLNNNSVWLVLERWGLQREYYDLPFQQQLLAQTDYVTEAQGIFILHSKTGAHPIRQTPAQPVQANFDNLVELTGYTVEPKRITPGQSLRLTLYWQALAAIPRDYTVFVHLRHSDGGNVAQADHRPLGNLYPTSVWPVGETIRESSALDLPPELSPGTYTLWAGLYLLETGERLPVQNDTSGENAVKLGNILLEK